MPTFTVKGDPEHAIELVPDFFRKDLSEKERQAYNRWNRDTWVVNGALLLWKEDSTMFEPGETVTFEEIDERLHQKFGGYVFPEIHDHLPNPEE